MQFFNFFFFLDSPAGSKALSEFHLQQTESESGVEDEALFKRNEPNPLPARLIQPLSFSSFSSYSSFSFSSFLLIHSFISFHH